MPVTTIPTSVVSEQRLRDCQQSARYWAQALGPFANQMNERADRYAIASAALSTLTGLGVWSTLMASTQWPAVLAVSVVAFASAMVALIPKIRGYGECAKTAAALSSRYGTALGKLTEALAALERQDQNAPDYASMAIDMFEAIRAEKQSLKPYPKDLQKHAPGVGGAV